MNLFVESTLILMQWVSGVCIFILFYIWLFKKYKNPKSHIFIFYCAIIGFNLISDIITTMFGEFTNIVRFSLFFIFEPLSILSLAFFISYLVLGQKIRTRYYLLAVALMIANLIPHLPYQGAHIFQLTYNYFNYSILGLFVLVSLSLIKMIRDYGKTSDYHIPKGLLWFLIVTYLHKATSIIFSSLGLLNSSFNTYSSILMILMILSFFCLLKVFYEVVIKSDISRVNAIPKEVLMEMSEEDLLNHIHTSHPELINKFAKSDITGRELSIIYFTMVGMSLKDSAEYFNVSSKTIEQYRYRLKKKIGLEYSLSKSLHDMNIYHA